MPATIRLASETDALSVQAIYAPYVEGTAISFETETPTIDEMRERIRKSLRQFPWLVCEDAQGTPIGYTYASKHRERAAYQWSVDVTVYIAPHAHRSGVGRALYTSLFALLSLQGFYHAYAGITLPNESSVGLHTALGFQSVGVYQNVGYKFGKWHDVFWCGLQLQPLAETPVPPRPLNEITGNSNWQTALDSGLPLIRL